MSKPSPLRLAAWLAGFVCLVALVLVWSGRRAAPARAPAAPEAAAEARVPAPSITGNTAAPRTLALSERARTLLRALQRELTRSDVREREAVLTFKDEAALRRFLSRAEKAGFAVLGRVDALRAVRVRFDDQSGLVAELTDNAADYADLTANNLIGIPLPPSRENRAAVDQVPFGNDTLAFLGATGDRSAWGRATTIAIIDTGIAPDATFGAGRVTALDIGLGIAPGTGRNDGHGTAVAALAAGASPDAPGIAPGAQLLSIRVTDANGMSDLFTVSQAIVTAVDAGARIINVSLGGYSTGTVLDAAIDYATQRGALIVAAAGNDQAAQLAWPAADARVVSVGAVDKAEQQVSFSNSGPQLQLSAPGYGVQTAWLNGQRVTVDGTSASAPIVSGAIAAVMSQNPSLTPRQAADLLGQTANDTGQPGADPAYGRGIVNLGTAMNSGNIGYVDTAIASHFYDLAQNQMQFTVQNRSGRTVSGMSLAITAGNATTSQTVPSLAPGETYVARIPVNDAAVRATSGLAITSELNNPQGVVDRVPANNRRSSVLSTPARP